MITHEHITGVILAGGRSSRMGSDKGMLEVRGKKMIEHVLDALRHVVNEIIIIANNSHYNNYDCRVFRDIIPGCGPMGGIHTALTFSRTEKNLIVACDMPFIHENIFRHIIRCSDNASITVPVCNSTVQPLCALYTGACRQGFLQLLSAGRYSLTEAMKNFSVRYMDLPTEMNGTAWSRNINTAEEYRLISEAAEKRK